MAQWFKEELPGTLTLAAGFRLSRTKPGGFFMIINPQEVWK